MARDHLILYVNERRYEIREQALWTLSELLREHLRLTGTKVVCAEGDCGACSVLVGRLEPSAAEGPRRLVYRTVDSCIVFVAQLDLCHVVTVEGLGDPARLHPVQSAMVDSFGSQCGFCTPGFVVTLAGLAEEARRRGDERLRRDATVRGLTGNLCRCTGYVQILEAAEAVALERVPAIDELCPAGELVAEAAAGGGEDVEITFERPDSGANTGRTRVSIPATIDRSLALLQDRPEARIVAGATDLGVLRNKGRIELEDALVLGRRIPGWSDVSIEENVLVMGAGATWSQVEAAVGERLPQLAAILQAFGGPQIRELGTVGGNLVNASPIADSLPFLFVCEAELEIAGPKGQRRVEIEDFYLDYKEIALEPGEIVTRVTCSLPTADEILTLDKVSRRRDLDISTFTAAILLGLDGATIVRARVALGGVGPVVIRARQAEKELLGRPFEPETMRAAGVAAAAEIRPISDVRGSARHRRRLAENVFLGAYWRHAEASSPFAGAVS